MRMFGNANLTNLARKVEEEGTCIPSHITPVCPFSAFSFISENLLAHEENRPTSFKKLCEIFIFGTVDVWGIINIKMRNEQTWPVRKERTF